MSDEAYRKWAADAVGGGDAVAWCEGCLSYQAVPDGSAESYAALADRIRGLEEEAGLKEFFRDPSLSGDATAEEIEFLKNLKFKGRRPSLLYHYSEPQHLRGPLHFSDSPDSAQPAESEWSTAYTAPRGASRVL